MAMLGGYYNYNKFDTTASNTSGIFLNPVPVPPPFSDERAQRMLLAAAKVIETIRGVAESLKEVDQELALRALAALETYDNEVAEPPAPAEPPPGILFQSSFFSNSLSLSSSSMLNIALSTKV